MRARRARLSLTGQVALLSLIPIVALGFVLARVLQTQIVQHTLADAGESAQLVARLGIQPWLTPRDLREGLSARGRPGARSSSCARGRCERSRANQDLERGGSDRVLRRPRADRAQPRRERRRPAATPSPGAPPRPRWSRPRSHTETASEVGLGRLVEVYVPLRFTRSGPPAGAFEIYLSYGPIAATIATTSARSRWWYSSAWRCCGRSCTGSWPRASGRLRRQAQENDQPRALRPAHGAAQPDAVSASASRG